MLVLKLFHGTPMYSQAPQLQQDLFSSHRFNILASIGLFATTLPPWQLESGCITLLLKTLQGLLILTLTYYMILWCLWPHLLLSPPLLSSGHPDPFAIPGTCQVCFCFRTCALSICSTWILPPDVILAGPCLAQTLPSQWALPWLHYSNAVLYASPTSSTFSFL